MGFVRGVRMQLHVLDVESGDRPPGDRCRRPRRRRGLEPGLAPSSPSRRCPMESTTSTRARPCHVIDAADPKARPQVVAFADGFAGTVTFAPDGETTRRRRLGRRPVSGHAGLYAVDRRDRRRDTSSRHPSTATSCPARPPTPAPCRSSRRPATCCSPSATAAAPTCTPSRSPAASPALVHGGDGNVVSGLSVAGSKAAIALATPTSFGEIVLIDLESGDQKTVSPRTASTPRGHRALRARAARVHDQRRRHRAGLDPARPRGHRRDSAARRRARRPAQRVERRGRRHAPVPPGARRPRLDGAHRQPARQRRLRRVSSTPRSSAPGERPTRRTSSSRSTSSSPRASPTRSASR